MADRTRTSDRIVAAVLDALRWLREQLIILAAILAGFRPRGAGGARRA